MAARFTTLHEIVVKARANLSRNNWDYLTGGSDSETTLRRNRLALDRLALRHRVLNDVSEVSLQTPLLGQSLRLPVLMAPIGSVQAFAPEGGADVARAAHEFGTMMILSSACEPDFETVADLPGAKIYQLYVVGDEDWLFATIERAQALGYAGFCLTVDTQVYSRRERDILKRYVPASGRSVAGAPVRGITTRFGNQARITWDTVAKIKARFDIPLILKGVAAPQDAAQACEAGVDVVYVSNHGGRQLDQGPGTMELLPDVVDAVAQRAPVVVDGGIMRGTDVVKALCMGASAVGVGRLEGLAMAAGGAEAVVRMLEILEHESATAMALCGASCPAELSRDMVVPGQPVTEPHVLSAFPLLKENY